MSNGQPPIGANLSFTKFLFIVADQDDAVTLGRIRTAGSNISRGFFNDYDADGSRDVQPQETIQFLLADGAPHGREGIGAAKYVVQLSENYRPRLEEVACELKQRQGEFDFITYFECSDENLPIFDQICRALRDERQNPEWKYVLEGPEWRGKRVLRW